MKEDKELSNTLNANQLKYINPKALKWIEALESGNFKQGQYRLVSTEDEYCCLGVACEVLGAERKGGGYVDGNSPCRTGGLPQQVLRELGMKSDMGSTIERFTINDVEVSGLVSANDAAGASLKQIAEILRNKPEIFFKEIE